MLARFFLYTFCPSSQDKYVTTAHFDVTMDLFLRRKKNGRRLAHGGTYTCKLLA